MCNELLKMDAKEVRRNINRKAALPYPPHPLALLPAIILLTIIAIFLVVSGTQYLVLDVIQTVLAIVYGPYKFSLQLSFSSIVWVMAQLLVALFGIFLLFKITQYIRYQSLAEKKLNQLVTKGQCVSGIVTTIEPHGSMYKMRYAFTFDDKSISSDYITATFPPVNVGDEIKICSYDSKLNLPLFTRSTG